MKATPPPARPFSSKPIGYELIRTGNRYTAHLIREGEKYSDPWVLAQGRNAARVRRRAAKGVVRALHEWEDEQGTARTRVLLVPPVRGPRGGAGDSGASIL